MNKTFKKGAKWVRVDFHLHTNADKEFSVKDQDNYIRDYTQSLIKAEIKVGAITNHNKFDYSEYRALKKAAKEHTLLLPGVELSTNEGANGVHTLIIFGEDWLTGNQDRISPFISSMFSGKAEAEYQHENGRSDKGILEVVDELAKCKRNYFIVFAHVEQSSGLWKELRGGKLSDFCGERYTALRERSLGFQKVRTHDAAGAGRKNELGRIQVQQQLGGWYPAEVEGSDCKSIAEIGKGKACYLKLGELSYSSVEFALRDHKQRVCLSLPEENVSPRIASVSFEGGLLHGRNFDLNDELNCIIGSRGSGKSSFIECLRYGLNILAEEDAKYKDDLVKAMMGNGGKITIKGFDQHNQAFSITRIHGNEPIVSVQDNESKLLPQDILPQVLYFGQKDLGVRHDNFETNFFEKLLSPVSHEDKETEETLHSLLNAAVNDWDDARSANEKEKDKKQEAERLKGKLDLFRVKGVEKKLERLIKFDTDKRKLIDLIGELQNFHDELKPESYNWSYFSDDWLELKTPELKEVSQVIKQSLIGFKALESEHTLILGKLDLLIVSLREQLRLVGEKEQELQEEFAEIQREINEPNLDIDEFRELKRRLQQLEKYLTASKNKGGVRKEAMSKVLSVAQKLQEHRRQVFTKRYSELQEKQGQLPPSLKLEMSYQENKKDFDQFLKTILAGSGFRKTSYEIICENFTNGFQMFERYEELKKLLGGTADADKIIEALEENLFKFLSNRVADQTAIHYDNTSVRELSLGQRATALLQLLMSLNEQSILIVDQPEDDLDNETVYQQVVTPLATKKKYTQFIVATHNPNIPVLGDSEQVHACHEKSKGVYKHESGSLDSKVTRNSIVNIMEGGEEAFKQRKKIYHQWSKD